MSAELLTTKEVEGLIQLNRVTIYRLIREADFPAVKIGNQWRFPRQAVEAWLAERGRLPQDDTMPPPLVPQGPTELSALFNTPEMSSLLQAFSRATGLSVVVTSPDGRAYFDCQACRHPFCQLVHDTSKGRDACFAARAARDHADDSAHLLDCASGLRYLRAPIDGEALDDAPHEKEQPIAYVIIGPLLTDETQVEQVRGELASFSQDIGVAAEPLLTQFQAMQRFSNDQIRILLDLLSSIVSAMLHVVRSQRTVTQRLREIAWLAAGETPSDSS